MPATSESNNATDTPSPYNHARAYNANRTPRRAALRGHSRTLAQPTRSRVRGGPARLQVRPLLSLLYGSCRYGTRTSQPPLSRSGCGPCRSETVPEMKSPTGLFESPVYSKTSTKVTGPALRLKVGPTVIETFSNRPDREGRLDQAAV